MSSRPPQQQPASRFSTRAPLPLPPHQHTQISSSSGGINTNNNNNNNNNVNNNNSNENNFSTQQSLSGSETDISTSNENLSNEEKYVIRHTARQEPQGQENQQITDRNSLRDSLVSNPRSNRSSLDMSQSSYNTFIIHGAGDEPWSGRNSGPRGDPIDMMSSSMSGGNPQPPPPSYLSLQASNIYLASVSGAGGGGESPRKMSQSPIQQKRGSTATPPLPPSCFISSPSSKGDQQQHYSNVRMSLDNNSSTNSSRVGSSSYDTGVQEITEIPDDYLNQSSVLKHLAMEVKTPSPNGTKTEVTDITSYLDAKNLPPPPEYPTNQKWKDKSPLQQAALNNSRHNKLIMSEKMALSKSQPDLSKVGEPPKADLDFNNGFRRGVSAPRPPTKGKEECEKNQSEEVWPQAEMVDILIKENSALKMELDNLYQRVAKTQKLEQEIAKVHKAQEDLVQSCERRERLEKAARNRLQADNRRLQELNRSLREQVDLLSNQMLTARFQGGDSSVPDSLWKELSKREVLIAQLIQQNKEHVAAKERQEIELAAQRVTLQEQRTHIDILDTALTNAQANVVRLEEECRKKQVFVERVAQLQRALSSLQLASDRREQTERNLRLQLERELERTKMQNGSGDQGNNNGNHGNNGGGGSSNGSPSNGGRGGGGGWGESPNAAATAHHHELVSSELKKRLREKDEKIMRLEGECSKWEQRYMEESAIRQAAIDAASLPKDAKIAALEKTSQETEKIIAEARNEKIRHMDEVHAAQKRVADLESRMKDLESRLAERDAMIKVLQKHTYDKEGLSSVLGRSPHHTPHPSLSGADIDHVLGSTVSREELVSSVLTSSTAFGSGNSYAGSDSSYHMPSYSKYENKCFDSTKQTLDNQLKEIDNQLDSQLLSKRGLCCFPGFTNPVTAQRKGKIPKPLLASVTVGGGSAGGGSGNNLTNNNNGSNNNNNNGSLISGPYDQGAMLLLEKQGRTSQQQRMQDSNENSSSAKNDQRCPAPSSLPRPPRSSSHHRSGLPRRMVGDYNRLTETPGSAGGGDTPPPSLRKKSDGGDSLSSNASSSRRASPARSLMPPRKLGEYGRLSESGGSSQSLRKPQSRSPRVGERDSASTLSDNSATSSLPPPSKVRLFGGGGGGGGRSRGGSLGRDSKTSSTDSTTSKYRIQF